MGVVPSGDEVKMNGGGRDLILAQRSVVNLVKWMCVRSFSIPFHIFEPFHS